MAQTMRLRVEGIHCERCEAQIEGALSKVPGVVKVTASRAAQGVDVVMQGDGAAKTVKDRLRDLGYEPAV
ncbi:MAG: heavy-metal-associated domain-containing protein [Firmicutes bacterium]|nr:heavy-metal-associated domain-containing protein [Bacillota bacterium]